MENYFTLVSRYHRPNQQLFFWFKCKKDSVMSFTTYQYPNLVEALRYRKFLLVEGNAFAAQGLALSLLGLVLYSGIA